MADVEGLEASAATEDGREAGIAEAVAEDLQRPEAAHPGDPHGFAVADAAGPPVEAVPAQPEAVQERAGLGGGRAGLGEVDEAMVGGGAGVE